ncbi:MAG TPA: rhomboid family intramembrane serine protease [Gemmatimonadaceae bacterium]|nr:rhomboid family intramembrane serine protease [Gemmatimonadaceae bacterium]
MIPLSDDLPTLRTPVMTYAILGAIWAVWIFYQQAGFNDQALAASVCNLGMVPGELTHRAALGTSVPIGPGMACVVDNDAVNKFTPITSMFLHGGWGHIIGNSLFFWVFGNNVEDSMGRLRFLIFYLLCGLAAAAAHIASAPASAVPTVGASGAISGVMGAYLLLYPKARVNMLFIFIFFVKVIPIRAWAVLLWWFAWQLIAALPQLSSVSSDVSGVAVWAHVGGFVAGLLLVNVFKNQSLVDQHRRVYQAQMAGGEGLL